MALFSPARKAAARMLDLPAGGAGPAARGTPLPLRVNFSWTIVGNVVYTGCQWGMLVTLVKLGQPEMVGQFALALAVTAPIMLGASLQLRSVQATDASGEYLFGDYLGLRVVMTLLALLVIAGIAARSGYRADTALVVFAVGTAKAFESISDVFYGRLQGYELMDRIAKSQMIKGVLSLVALVVAVWLTGSVFVGALALAAIGALTLFGYDIPVSAQVTRGVARSTAAAERSPRRRELRPRWAPRTMLSLTWLSLPLGVVLMLISLSTNIPRYAIETHLGERELGVFAALAYAIVAGNIVVGALGQSATPRLARYYAAADGRAFGGLLLKLVAVGALLGALGVLLALVAGERALSVVYGREYAMYATLLLWLMTAAALGYVASFLGYGLTAARYFRVQLPLYAAVTATAAIASTWLVPTQGLGGAATALVISAAVQVIGSLLVLTHALRFHGSAA